MARLRKTSSPAPEGGIVGPVRFARSDGDLSSLRAGDVALVEMPELDERQARALVDRQVQVVLNASASSSGRVPNQGPTVLAGAGIALVDLGDDGIWSRLRNGEIVQVVDGRVLRDGALVATGSVLDRAQTRSALAAAESGLATRLDSLTANATDHIQREQAMLLDGARIPHLRTTLRRRPAVVVSRGYDATSDLKSLKRFIRERDPVLIGAGPGADLLLDAGLTPDLLVGALDNLSDRAIAASGEVVVTTPSGQVEGPERLEKHGKDIVTFVSTGSDDDLAILLADTNEAAVIVHVGAPPTLTDFLQRPPGEVARMFVARLRAGAKIVDAKSVSQLAPRPTSWWPFALLVLAGVIALAVAITVTPAGQDWVDQLADTVGLSTAIQLGLRS